MIKLTVVSICLVLFISVKESESLTPDTLGCYKDWIPRALSGNHFSNKIMTVEACRTYCGEAGYDFAGIQTGDECFCGDAYNKYGEANSDSECNYDCVGDPSGKCGGGWRNSVYTAAPKQIVSPPVYIGCYNDEEVRDLEGAMLNDSSIAMTINYCLNYCRKKGYEFAGLQYSFQCFCGNSYGLYGQASSDDECNTPCKGKANQICGGPWKNSIYSTSDYIGCYKDESQRDLPDKTFVNPAMTIEMCTSYCGNAGYKYSGLQSPSILQSSSQCFCGNSFGIYGQAPKSDCNSDCTGNNNEKCGGGWRNSIYAAPRQTVPSPPVYIGCYKDGTQRDLDDSSSSNNNMNVNNCVTYCRKIGYKFAGLQSGNQCYCGNSYGRYGKASSNACNQACVGNGDETCGGSSSNSIYATTDYIGCYVDESTRDLSEAKFSNSLMSIELCKDYCKNSGYSYAGLQKPGLFQTPTCYCGDTYGKYGVAEPFSECDWECSGNVNEICGGGWRNSIYAANANEISIGK